MPAAQKAGRPASLLRLSTTALLVVGLLGSSAGSAVAAPAPPVAQPVAVEVAQPYIGQSICDPVAKPGVRAFANLLLTTYPATSSLGIVRDCGAGGQSEHKEGRAFDWGASYYDASERAAVNDALTWLTATDRNGNQAAMARRVGLMYMIWNKQIWKAYDSRGWQPYSGPNPHTDHVHFSVGWNGAKKVTSFWDGTVAPLDGMGDIVSVVGGDQDDLRAGLGQGEARSGLESRAIRKVDVEQDDIGLQAFGFGKAFGEVGSLADHDVAVGLERAFGAGPKSGVVVDDEDGGRH